MCCAVENIDIPSAVKVRWRVLQGMRKEDVKNCLYLLKV